MAAGFFGLSITHLEISHPTSSHSGSSAPHWYFTVNLGGGGGLPLNEVSPLQCGLTVFPSLNHKRRTGSSVQVKPYFCPEYLHSPLSLVLSSLRMHVGMYAALRDIVPFLAPLAIRTSGYHPPPPCSQHCALWKI